MNYFKVFSYHVVAALSALLRSMQYLSELGLAPGEYRRYFKKSVSFGLCYSGFAITGGMRRAWWAGEAGFLCCAYDVVTDWRHFDPSERIKFEQVLRRTVSDPTLESLALGLYYKELYGQLGADGLERGSIALRFAVRMMGCEKECEAAWLDLDSIGRLLQIVDDVLDYEDDLTSGDINCLNSPNREAYLRKLLQELNVSKAKGLFGDSDSILLRVIERARSKAQFLLTRDQGVVLISASATA